MNVFPKIQNTIGMTPLVRIRRLLEKKTCDLLGKLEFFNPWAVSRTVSPRP